MSIWAKKWAYEQRVGQSGAKAVLVALAEFADETGFCFPSQPTLASMTEIKERTVRAHLKLLESKGFIAREHRRVDGGRWTSDGYMLLAEAEQLKPPAAKSAARHQRQILPEAKSASGEKLHDGRQNPPAAKSAAKPSVESDEPSVEPSKEDIPARAEGDPPDWIPLDSWKRWIQHRKEIKHVVTVSQAEAQFRVLEKFRARGMLPEDVIEQSIANGWQGLFELKPERNGNGAYQKSGRSGQAGHQRDANSRDRPSEANAHLRPKRIINGT